MSPACWTACLASEALGFIHSTEKLTNQQNKTRRAAHSGTDPQGLDSLGNNSPLFVLYICVGVEGRQK